MSFSQLDVIHIDIQLIASQIHIRQTLQLVAVTLLIYDTVITLEEEAKYFWNVPEKPTDYLYFLNRYAGIFGAIVFSFYNSNNVDVGICNFAFWSNDVTHWIIIASIDYCIMIRVLALYSEDRTLSLFLRVLFALDMAIVIGTGIYIGVSQQVTVRVIVEGTMTCITKGVPLRPWSTVNRLVPVAFKLVLLMLALRKSFEYWKTLPGLERRVLLNVVIRDQVLILILAMASAAFSISGVKIEASNLPTSTLLTSLGNDSFLSVACSRMLLNLREAIRRDEDPDWATTTISMSEMDFVSPRCFGGTSVGAHGCLT